MHSKPRNHAGDEERKPKLQQNSIIALLFLFKNKYFLFRLYLFFSLLNLLTIFSEIIFFQNVIKSVNKIFFFPNFIEFSQVVE